MKTCSLCMRNVLDSSLIIYPFNQVSNNYCYQHPLQMPLELEGVLIVLKTGGQIVGNFASGLQAPGAARQLTWAGWLVNWSEVDPQRSTSKCSIASCFGVLSLTGLVAILLSRKRQGHVVQNRKLLRDRTQQ